MQSVAAVMADVKEQKSALWRRQEQLDRWQDSETNQESVERKNGSRIQFQDGCVFLAACSSGDTEEVVNLLSRGADINTANIDGLTALHQACIDDNIDMVKFLVEHQAEIDACDNEGWTPLHATASCGFLEIAKYLINEGANVAAVNNDGELPLDIAEGDDMEEMLMEDMENRGVDAEAARREEEEQMLADAAQWINSGKYADTAHPKTGATALHVASAKGYIKVMNLLIQAGANIDAQDFDGWSPLHAAAHWGQEDACRVLAENFANMQLKNLSGQTPFDVAEPDQVSFLEELEKKQAVLKKNKETDLRQINTRAPPPLKRRSSVTRMSVDQRQNLVLKKDLEEERSHLKDVILGKSLAEQERTHICSSSSSEEGGSDSETEKRNQINKQQMPTSPAAKVPSIIPKPLDSLEPVRPEGPASWRTGLRRMGSSSAVPDTSTKESDRLTRSSSSPFLAPEKKKEDVPRRPVSLGSASDNQENKNKRLMDKEGSGRSGDRPASVAISSVASVSTGLTQGTTSTTSTTASPSSRRSIYVPPQRDEERETERKARAKRARETRRSTQGVTKEDLERAEQTLKAAGDASSRNKEEVSSSQEDSRSDKENRPDDTSQILRRRAWEKDKDKEDDSRSSYRRSKDSRDSALESSYTGTTAFLNRLRSSAPSITSSSDLDAFIDRTYRSKYLRPKDEGTKDQKEEKDKESKKEDKEDKEDPSQKSSAIRTRRKRESRRPTGKVTLEDIPQVSSEDDSKAKGEHKKEEDKSTHSSRYGPSSRLGDSSGSSYLNRSERSSSYTPGSYTRSYTSSTTDKDTDYKKLYEEETLRVEKLKKELKRTQDELEETKKDLEKSRLRSDPSRSHEPSSERRERRALERKLSEMEEELKEMETIKADNQRLKDENGALIRVISKLSK